MCACLTGAAGLLTTGLLGAAGAPPSLAAVQTATISVLPPVSQPGTSPAAMADAKTVVSVRVQPVTVGRRVVISKLVGTSLAAGDGDDADGPRPGGVQRADVRRVATRAVPRRPRPGRRPAEAQDQLRPLLCVGCARLRRPVLRQHVGGRLEHARDRLQPGRPAGLLQGLPGRHPRLGRDGPTVRARRPCAERPVHGVPQGRERDRPVPLPPQRAHRHPAVRRPPLRRRGGPGALPAEPRAARRLLAPAHGRGAGLHVADRRRCGDRRRRVVRRGRRQRWAGQQRLLPRRPPAR